MSEDLARLDFLAETGRLTETLLRLELECRAENPEERYLTDLICIPTESLTFWMDSCPWDTARYWRAYWPQLERTESEDETTQPEAARPDNAQPQAKTAPAKASQPDPAMPVSKELE